MRRRRGPAGTGGRRTRWRRATRNDAGALGRFPRSVLPQKVCENYHPKPDAVNHGAPLELRGPSPAKSWGSLITAAANDAATDDEIVTVPHDGLTRRDRALGLVEDHLGFVVAHGDDGRGRAPMAGAKARLDAHGFTRRIAGVGVDVAPSAPVSCSLDRSTNDGST